MAQARIVGVLGFAAALLLSPALADAQNRSRPATGRAVPRTGPPPRVAPPREYRAPYRTYYSRPYYGRPYYYRPYYYGPLATYPGFYGPYAYGYGFGYGPYAHPGYGYSGYPYRYGWHAPYGGVRIDLPQRDAEVYVDGYFAGIVDDFDGAFQHLHLEPGPHRIEVRAPGFAPLMFEVRIEPGRTVTYRGQLRAP